MARTFDTTAFGTEGTRRPADVKTTERLILPYSEGKSNLVVLPHGPVVAESTPEGKVAADSPEGDFFSRIGRNFRSFEGGAK